MIILASSSSSSESLNNAPSTGLHSVPSKWIEFLEILSINSVALGSNILSTNSSSQTRSTASLSSSFTKQSSAPDTSSRLSTTSTSLLSTKFEPIPSSTVTVRTMATSRSPTFTSKMFVTHSSRCSSFHFLLHIAGQHTGSHCIHVLQIMTRNYRSMLMKSSPKVSCTP